jgi:hypothetical protein
MYIIEYVDVYSYGCGIVPHKHKRLHTWLCDCILKQ